MLYSELIHKLFNVNLFGGIKFGLENSFKLNSALGSPEKTFKSIHVAGTNGKGSVVTKMAKAYELAGYRVGIYTSPHISCFRERIRINEKMISEENVQQLLSVIFEIVKGQQIPATFFEITTALAFKYFADQAVDVAIIETGLGGRLDATNIITPLLSIITSISLEHTEILGQTIEEIAKEKGGIIKKNVPVLVGPRVPLKIIQAIAKEKSSPSFQSLLTSQNYDEENSSIAKIALELLNKSNVLPIPKDAIENGICSLPPCRLETYTPQDLPEWKKFPEALIMDVAHNPDGLSRLFEVLNNRYPKKKISVVFGLSKTKDIHACIAILTKYATEFYPVVAANGRGVEAQELADLLTQFRVSAEAIHLYPSIPESLKAALEHSFEQDQITLVCGTFFIMSSCRELLNIHEPRDSFDMNERTGVSR